VNHQTKRYFDQLSVDVDSLVPPSVHNNLRL